MYADDIYLLTPSAIGLQRMFDVSLDFSIRNEKSMSCFKLKNYTKLYYPNARPDYII